MGVANLAGSIQSPCCIVYCPRCLSRGLSLRRRHVSTRLPICSEAPTRKRTHAPPSNQIPSSFAAEDNILTLSLFDPATSYFPPRSKPISSAWIGNDFMPYGELKHSCSHALNIQWLHFGEANHKPAGRPSPACLAHPLLHLQQLCVSSRVHASNSLHTQHN